MQKTQKQKKVGARHLALVVVLLAGAALALSSTVDVSLADEAGVTMALPDRLGDWLGAELRYCHQEGCRREFVLQGVLAGAELCPDCGSGLFTMSREEYDALPRDTEFIKAQYESTDGRALHVAIVLSGQERNSIHRPQRCLVGQGFEIRGSRTLRVPLDEERAVDVMVLRNAREIRTPQGPDEQRMYYAYWFVGQNRQTPYHLERMFWLAWDRVVHSVAHKWAYIAISGNSHGDLAAEDEEIRAFVSKLHEKIVL